MGEGEELSSRPPGQDGGRRGVGVARGERHRAHVRVGVLNQGFS